MAICKHGIEEQWCAACSHKSVKRVTSSKRKRRKRKKRRIFVVSGGLPSLGKRR